MTRISRRLRRMDETIDILELWRSIVKRKWVVISVLAIFLVTAILATSLTVSGVSLHGGGSDQPRNREYPAY